MNSFALKGIRFVCEFVYWSRALNCLDQCTINSHADIVNSEIVRIPGEPSVLGG